MERSSGTLTTKLEQIQRHAARFITGDYRRKETGRVSFMLEELELPGLRDERCNLRLAFLCRVSKGIVPAVPANDFIKPQRANNDTYNRNVPLNVFPATSWKDHKEQFKVFPIPAASTDQLKNSFVRTIVEWNHLNDQQVGA